jgi:NAD(P)-dependent dehydrogenase (short-subunit alcohol dehydrogenase family)
MKLKGKVVVVTGGFGSLGVAVANAAALQGATIALIDRAPAPDAAKLPKSLSNALLLGDVDLASLPAAESALATVAGKCGGIDVLANIAGAFRWQTLEGGALDTWDFLYAVNVKTAAAASKAVLPHLHKRGSGRIVNVGAASAAKAGAGMGAYAAAKAGVAKLTESLAEEMKDKNITVNAVLPSIIESRRHARCGLQPLGDAGCIGRCDCVPGLG